MIRLFRGPSKLGKGIIGAWITGMPGARSTNVKTGPMLQLWIQSATKHPVHARRDGSDRAQCGDCPHRDGGCYVNLSQAPAAVFRGRKKAKKVRGLNAIRAIGRGEAVRLGAYGDPAALPIAIVRALVSEARLWTGYTHQWRRASAQALRSLVMASVDSVAEAAEARAKGWRYFRVRAPGAPLLPGEIDCPAVSGRTTCAKCGLCAGTRHPNAPSISVEAHGGAVQKRKAVATVSEI